MMTRKDYIGISTILKQYAKPYMDELDFQDLVDEFGEFFFADNKNFSPNQFEVACFKE
jgi:hypothetical protein